MLLGRALLISGLLFSVVTVLPAHAQEPGKTAGDTVQNSALRAYLDCTDWRCDHDFLVTEMKWVNWMRERLDAEVHLLVTSEPTGSDGRRYTVVAIGQKRYAGKSDTLSFTANANDADDLHRRGLLRVLSQLLLPYAARTPLATRLSVNFSAPNGTTGAAQSARDRWNFWTYSLSANGYASGEQRQSSGNYYGNIDANRTTEAWKIRINSNFSYSQSSYEFSDGTSYTSLQRSVGLSSMAVKSVGPHWSVGARVSADRSDYLNSNLDAVAGPALEWDYYPYDQFARQKFTVLYSVGVEHFQFRETTIYGRDRETRPLHYLSIGLSKRQPWGSANVSLTGSQFLNSLKNYNANINGGVDIRVGKGFSVNLSGNVSRVRDQLYLPRGEATDDEVIARQRALSTNYRYFVFAGFRYQFGSIFNSVVNPRFASFGGGGQTIMMSF